MHFWQFLSSWKSIFRNLLILVQKFYERLPVQGLFQELMFTTVLLRRLSFMVTAYVSDTQSALWLMKGCENFAI